MGGKKGGKAGSSKDERRAAKANANRTREHRKEARRALDRSELAQFAVAIKGVGLTLNEVGRDGNCFFRSLSDQLENDEHNHQEYREKVVDFVAKNQSDFEPFFSFGEGDDEEDANFGEYVERMRRDGEWAGQPELLAAARALNVHIMVHQFKMPAYRIDAPKAGAQIIHVSYHDGDHYNSVRDPTAGKPGRQGGSASATGTSQDETDAADGLEEQVGSLALRDEVPRADETAKKKSKDERRAAKAAASRAREQGADDEGASAGGGDDGRGEGVAADGEGGEPGAEADDDQGTLEARRQDKAKRKEEKRLRKEARNREAVAGSEPEKPQGDWTTAVISL